MWCHIRPLLLPFIRLCPQISRRRNVKTDPFNSNQCWNRVWSTELSVATLFGNLILLVLSWKPNGPPSYSLWHALLRCCAFFRTSWLVGFRVPAPWCISLSESAVLRPYPFLHYRVPLPFRSTVGVGGLFVPLHVMSRWHTCGSLHFSCVSQVCRVCIL